LADIEFENEVNKAYEFIIIKTNPNNISRSIVGGNLIGI
jgi:hypothetical protein